MRDDDPDGRDEARIVAFLAGLLALYAICWLLACGAGRLLTGLFRLLGDG